MKFKFINKISFKVSIIYFLLAVINISYFTSIIFENQVDLITENSKLNAEKLVFTIVSSLKKFSNNFKHGKIFKAGNEKEIVVQIDMILNPIIDKYIIYKDTGKIIKQNASIELPETYIQDGMKAIADKDFTGKDYYIRINEKQYKMFFYLPMDDYRLRNSILFIQYDLKAFGDKRDSLYNQVIWIIVITVVFHIIFAVLLFSVIVQPIHQLHIGSQKISSGNLSSRVLINRKDEIGALAKSFNEMANSIQEKMETLNNQMKVITEANRKIEQLAITDELTGLYNRRYLFARMDEEIKRIQRREYDIGFIMIDIDNFKKLNDSYGHQIGDIVLREISNTIKTTCRNMDTIARYGGEEFAVLSPESNLDVIKKLAERIRASVEKKQISTDAGTLSISVSIGAVSFNKSFTESTINIIDKVIQIADVALYKAKKNGKNKVEIGNLGNV